MKFQKTRRVLSLVLSLLLVFTLWTPTTVKAADVETQSSDEVVISVGETTTLKASGWSFNTTWESSDTDVATVSNKGVVTGVAPGTVTITATSKGFFFGKTTVTEFTVTVVEKEESEAIQIKVGESTTLPAPSESGTTTWKSSDTNIATVSEDGVVTGLSEGTVTITATTKSGGHKFWFFCWGETTTTTEYTVVVTDDGETPEPDKETYTVTFETNGGSAVEAQTVEEGNKVTKPADPTKEGYTFAGWYIDEELATEYDFDTEATGDITLYAKWDEIGPDDANDPEDTTVSDDDVYSLSSSENEVLAESSSKVTFYVNSTLTVSSFELYCDGVTTGVLLYDDGDYTNHEDDIPNDGCYTGVYTIDIAEESTAIFTAVATIGETDIVTNEVEIFVYQELSDEQISKMDQISTEISTLLKDVDEELGEEATEEEKAETRYDKIYPYLESLEEEGIITDLEYNEDSCVISYTIFGTEAGVACYNDSSSTKEGLTAGRSSTNDGSSSANTFVATASADVATTSANVSLNYITYKEKALILNYCAQDITEEEDEAGEFWISCQESIDPILENAGFDLENRFSVTVDDFKSLQNYQFISVNCHGSYYGGGLFTAKTPVICTIQEVTKENKKTYSADLKKKRVCSVTTTDGNTVYWIKPAFFSFYYEEDPLDSSIFYVGCCKGAFNETLVNAIREAGADSVVAYSDTVYIGYNMRMLEDILTSLLAGDTINEAIIDAKNENGQNDYEVYGLSVNPADRKSEIAVCNVYGDSNSIIHASLLNGNFDSPIDLIRNKPTGWKNYGDSRSIFKLSGLSPQSSPKMGIISSGFGSMNNETTSAIYQTFLVPHDANTLTFSYDVVSEEPMEYVGSSFNDEFSVDILNTNGEILESLAYESINESDWYAIDGIDFPGGDNTTYHTRWKTISTSSISQYQNQLIVLRFVVTDTGDAIYDTAALIDSVSIN